MTSRSLASGVRVAGPEHPVRVDRRDGDRRHPAVYLWAEASVMNVLFLVLVLWHESNATALRESLGEAERAYA